MPPGACRLGSQCVKAVSFVRTPQCTALALFLFFCVYLVNGFIIHHSLILPSIAAAGIFLECWNSEPHPQVTMFLESCFTALSRDARKRRLRTRSYFRVSHAMKTFEEPLRMNFLYFLLSFSLYDMYIWGLAVNFQCCFLKLSILFLRQDFSMELFKQTRLPGQQAPASASPALTLQTHTTKLSFFFLTVFWVWCWT